MVVSYLPGCSAHANLLDAINDACFRFFRRLAYKLQKFHKYECKMKICEFLLFPCYFHGLRIEFHVLWNY